MTDPLSAVAGWPVVAAAGVVSAGTGVVASTGPNRTRFPWASVTKVLTAMAVWVAVEEGTVGWADAVGPPGATLAHLLAHASGVAPDSDAVLAPPGSRRIYSNHGFELAAMHLADRSGMPFERYLSEGVLQPLGLSETALAGSPAAGASGPLTDLMVLGHELLAPTLVSPIILERATAVAFPGWPGCCPDSAATTPTTGGSVSKSGATSSPTGLVAATRLARSDTSAGRVHFSGWIRPGGWRWARSPIGPSDRGRRGPGRPLPMRSSPGMVRPDHPQPSSPGDGPGLTPPLPSGVRPMPALQGPASSWTGIGARRLPCH